MATLRACLSPASFWTPERIGPQAAWVAHAPFALWLVEAARPRTLVELGTHGGFSYFTFCEAVERCGLPTQCYAVDTWTGDEHAGFHGEDAYRDVAAHNANRYSSFSTLVRSSFDAAAAHFSNDSIDLLHVDGRRLYQDVKHDFETWLPKLSSRAVVLFHDTNVRERGFGVFRFWEELREIYPNFEFLHGRGLGVLGVGTELPTPVCDLLGASANTDAVAHIRSAYGRLGSALSLVLRERELSARVESLSVELTGRSADKARLAADLARAGEQVAALETDLAARSAAVAHLDASLADAATRIADLEAKAAGRAHQAVHLDAELIRARNHAGQLAGELDTTQRQLQSMLTSTSWRLTRPLRRLGFASPKLARRGRRVLSSLGLGGRGRPDDRARMAALSRMTGRSPDEFLDVDRLKSRLSAQHPTPADRAANCRLLEASGLFDEAAYRAASGVDESANAAEHYLTVGWREGVEPGPEFEGAFLHPYYRSAGFDGPPVITYLVLRAAGWPVYPTRDAAEAIASTIRTSDLFDAVGYAARLRAGDDIDPALHYVIVGERMGFAPSVGFDPDYYGDRYPDVGQRAINRLGHYLASGRIEGRRPLPVAAAFHFDRSRLKANRDTILLVVHEASRTGAPILAHNLAKRLRRTYNIVVVLLAGGGLIHEFDAYCAAVVGPLTHMDWHPGEMKHLVRHILAAYPVSFAIVNSIASWMSVPPLGRALVPVVLLVHEFASYTRPKFAMQEGLQWATELVFSADLVARSAREEHPDLMRRPIHILPQGRCDLPVRETVEATTPAPELARAFRPPGMEHALVVLGCGFVHIRKGIDLFLSCAAAVRSKRPTRPVRFIWIGHGYDPEKDASYSCYLADQIARSGLEETVAIIDEIPDLAPAYAMTDVFFLSSRLDPLPNVTIDAAMQGLPVICFEGATGMADILGADASTRECVVPHLDVNAAADVIVGLANDEAKRRHIGEAIRKIGEAAFDMDRYVPRIAQLGQEAAAIMRQRREDLATLRDDPLFDPAMYLPFDAPRQTRSEAITDFIARWAVVGTAPASRDYFFRRPCAGFHPQIYAHENAGNYDTRAINPLAHFIRSGKPDGPWRHRVITPAAPRPNADELPATALHAHFHYPELAEDFFRKLSASRLRCDLLLSTDERGKARMLRNAAAHYQRGEVHIRVVPNRGRDIGAFLTGFGEDIGGRYEIVGHLHGKKSVFARNPSDPYLGDRWREFLWQNLLGDQNPMMDIVVGRIAADEKLGLVFPDSPHLPWWDNNREIAARLAARMAVTQPLPEFFDFPVGTMFWARTPALKPLFDLKLGWDDYPAEPIATDGTVLHALERLLPFVARHKGYDYAGTHVPGLTW
jgi:glycosyltransferase involved in cell wall biosynthesis